MAPQSYSGPDSANATVSGSCRDRAGNTTVRVLPLSYDATAPTVTGASASRGPDHNGWYNHALSIAFAGADATSGIDSCTQTSYSGPDSQTGSVSGTCRDRAGNTSGNSSFGFRYDGTGPVVTATPSRNPDSNGWYNHALSVSFAGTDATSGIDSCVAPQSYSGPDSQNASVSGSCVDRAGNTSVRSFALSYDGTAPHAFGAPAREPDSNGWYNQPIRVAFDGTDTTSGIDSCTAPQVYSGPDAANARERRLHRPGREHQRRRDVVARVRRHTSAGHRNTGAGSGRERLVQPLAGGRLQRRGCHFGSGQLHPRDLLRPGHANGLRGRLLQ